MNPEAIEPAIKGIEDSPEAIARDVLAISRLSAVPSLLRVICDNTGMGFAAVARVTEGSWTACAVQDEIAFGLKPGDQLEVNTTLCKESRAARQPVVFDHASADPIYSKHHTAVLYKLESYISVPIVLPDGRYFGNLCAVDPRPRRVSEAKTVTMFTLFADLISLQLSMEEHAQQTETALLDERATGELREQFIAVLGHDLRSPLNSVGVTAELLASRSEPDLEQMGRRLKSSTRRMAKLIDDVMDFTRARLGAGIGIKLAERGDLASAFQEVISEARDLHPGRTVTENIAIIGTCYCDRSRLQQLLANLLGNALTHGSTTHPVDVRVARQGNLLEIVVTNQGEPIATENLRRVFDPYWRPATSKQAGGLGLGLHICSQIVKEHGGSIHVESSFESGTRFIVSIPVHQRS